MSEQTPIEKLQEAIAVKNTRIQELLENNDKLILERRQAKAELKAIKEGILDVLGKHP